MTRRFGTSGPDASATQPRLLRTMRALQAALVLSLFAVMLGAYAAAHLDSGRESVEMRYGARPEPATFTPELARRYPGCIAEPRWPDGKAAQTVLVQPYDDYDAPVRPMPFDRMAALNDPTTTDRDDVRVIAACKGAVR